MKVERGNLMFTTFGYLAETPKKKTKAVEYTE